MEILLGAQKYASKLGYLRISTDQIYFCQLK